MTTKQEKARRMEIRKKVGNRVIEPPVHRERDRGGDLDAHACFSCRVSFKIALREGIAPCPNCRRPLAPMGRSFKAPKKSNIMQWKKVEKLWQADFRFHTYGTHDAPFPKRWQDVDKFIRDNRGPRWVHKMYQDR